MELAATTDRRRVFGQFFRVRQILKIPARQEFFQGRRSSLVRSLSAGSVLAANDDSKASGGPILT